MHESRHNWQARLTNPRGYFMRGLRFVAALCALAVPFVIASAAGAVNGNANWRAVCPGAVIDTARCHAQVVTDGQGNPNATLAPTGYGPAQFHGAYNLPTASSSPQTIAIVDAFDNPTAKADLDTYNSTYGLPFFPSCGGAVTTACFQKVNQDGAASPLPRKDQGWALEIALDVQTAHQICQNCKILLVEASTNSFANLATAVNTAAAMGANAISNSYGGGETSSTNGGAYNHPGIAITVSSGDGGYGVESPASYNTVVAVGGTTLNLTGNAYGSESVWNGSGSGCSNYFAAQPWQTSLSNWALTGCGTKRGVADVAADADPATGASVYDSTRYQGQSGWFKVGGTSLSAPLIAAVYGLAGNASSATYPASIPYAHQSSLHDVTGGSNGACGTIMCAGAVGYDGPTGVGTPNGLGGF
jgi:subtilase family serine protease